MGLASKLQVFKRKTKCASDKGSIVIEASLVLPIFIFFIVFLIYFVQMTLFSTALQTAASETVKTISAHIYPVSIAIESAGSIESGLEEVIPGSSPSDTPLIPKLSLTDWVSQYASTLPEPIGAWASMAASKGQEPLDHLQTSISEAALDPVIKPLIQPIIENTILEYDSLHVNGVDIPDLRNRTNPYFGIELTYELPIKVPFVSKSLRVQASATERIWIGATEEEGGAGDGQNDSGAKGSIEVLAKPEPAYVAGHATIRAKITPNASANLSVFYKTGESTAKHVGWATADENGFVEWTWFVGTRTTPGMWPFVIETSDGARIEVMFEVVNKS
ncbi:pilus assembly protein [Neobacillus mesonae]|nr:pilus assembly protein [Neobacillus mesonae]